MECHHEVKGSSPCCNFTLSKPNKPHHDIAESINYSMAVNTSISNNSPSVDNSSGSEESFEFINGELDDVNYVIEDHQKVSAVSLNNTQESNYLLTATKSSTNANFASEDSLVCDESFELIERTPDDSVHVMKAFCSSSTSNMKPQCAEDKNIAQPSSISDIIINSISSDSDASFEPISICAKENHQSCNHQGNVSPCSPFEIKSASNTVFKKEYSFHTGVCTNNDESKKEGKILGSIADKKKADKSKNVPMDSEKIFPDRFVMKELIKGVKNCDIAEKNLTNDKDNNQFKANVSVHDERLNPKNKNLIYLAEKKDVSIPANVCKEIISDTVKRVIKGIESCSISDKEFDSNTTVDKNYSDEFKTNLNTNNHNFALSINNLTSTMTSNKKSEPKNIRTYLKAKRRKRCSNELFEQPQNNKMNCDKEQSRIYEAISDGRKDKEKNGEEEYPTCGPSKHFVERPNMPKDSFKDVSDASKEDMLESKIRKRDLTHIDKSYEKYEPKLNEIKCEINYDTLQTQVYQVASGGDREDDNNEEKKYPSCTWPLKYRNIFPRRFVERSLPEAVLFLNSDDFCYRNRQEQIIKDDDDLQWEYPDYCSEEGCRRLQESVLSEIAEKFNRRETTKKPKKNSTCKSKKRRKKRFSWTGFDIHF